MKKMTVTETIEKIKKVFNRNSWEKDEYEITIEKGTENYWIQLYSTYISFSMLKKLEKEGINVVIIRADKRIFSYTEGELIECTKVSIAVEK